MQPENKSEDPWRKWMRFAKADLTEAKRLPPPDGLYELPCFHAQQAAEKSIKAVLVKMQIQFPYTHDLKKLLRLVPTDVAAAEEILDATELTDYAVTTRYPGEEEPLTEEDHREAVRLAEAVVEWASMHIGQ